MKKELNSIQYLRALAVVMVVWFHARSQYPWIEDIFVSKIGSAGVDLFFVISGFIMVYTTHNRSITPIQFFWRRILRIVPLYWFFTFSLIIIAFALPNATNHVHLELTHILASLFFIPIPSPAVPGTFWPVLIPGWTLNFEMAFYALFALILWFPEKFRIPLLTASMVSIVYFGQNYGHGILQQFYSSTIILEFLVGALIGKVYVTKPFMPDRLIGMLLIFVSIGLFWVIPELDLGDRFVRNGIPSSVMVIGALFLNFPEGTWHKILHELGNASYSIYLSHVFALGLLRFIWGKIYGITPLTFSYGLLFMTLAVVLSCIVGWASYRMIEIKINKALRHKKH